MKFCKTCGCEIPRKKGTSDKVWEKQKNCSDCFYLSRYPGSKARVSVIEKANEVLRRKWCAAETQ